jgi:hypothetical protein
VVAQLQVLDLNHGAPALVSHVVDDKHGASVRHLPVVTVVSLQSPGGEGENQVLMLNSKLLTSVTTGEVCHNACRLRQLLEYCTRWYDASGCWCVNVPGGTLAAVPCASRLR